VPEAAAVSRGIRTFVRRLAHDRGANFSLGFRLLPPAKRRAVYAAYAACRIPDDIVDEAGEDVASGIVHRRLDEWSEELEAAYAGRPHLSVTRALVEVLDRFPIPKQALQSLVEGCRMDLERTRYATFAELERYCELVAVTISDISLTIFGALHEEARSLGRHLALALQLTNICRDVGEDVLRGRIYLPLDELGRFSVSETEVSSGEIHSDRYRRLMAFQCGRAREHFRRANRLPLTLERDSRPAVRVMGGVYRRVLDRVHRDPVQAYSVRADLPRWQRFWVVAWGFLGRSFVV
jgi:phytoene synthase